MEYTGGALCMDRARARSRTAFAYAGSSLAAVLLAMAFARTEAAAQTRPASIPSRAIIVGENNIERVKDFPASSDIFRSSTPAARISRPDIFGLRSYCSGALIGEDILLTAGHCLDRRVKEWLVAFDHLDTGGRPEPYRVREVLRHLPEDDLAMLRLEGKPGLKYGYFRIAAAHPAPGDPLVLFHHPAGEIKSVSLKDCSFYEIRDRNFVHTCDTEMGSSGAPILNSRFELVAVHQGGLTTEKYMLNYGKRVQPAARRR